VSGGYRARAKAPEHCSRLHGADCDGGPREYLWKLFRSGHDGIQFQGRTVPLLAQCLDSKRQAVSERTARAWRPTPYEPLEIADRSDTTRDGSGTDLLPARRFDYEPVDCAPGSPMFAMPLVSCGRALDSHEPRSLHWRFVSVRTQRSTVSWTPCCFVRCRTRNRIASPDRHSRSPQRPRRRQSKPNGRAV